MIKQYIFDKPSTDTGDGVGYGDGRGDGFGCAHGKRDGDGSLHGRSMSKGYIQRWKDRKEPGTVVDEVIPKTDYWFTADSANAAHWASKEAADIDCGLFNRANIEIPSLNGGTHICTDFKSEERAPGEFVVFCEAPFVPADNTSSAL